MSENKQVNGNALAELAERLDKGRWNLDVNDYEKAVRIIAELAKVQEMERMLSEEDNDVPVNVEMGIMHSYQTNCINKCRAIAEEAVKR